MIQKHGSKKKVQGMSYTFRPSSRWLRNDRRCRFLRCWFAAATWPGQILLEFFVPFFSHTPPVTIRVFVRIKGDDRVLFFFNCSEEIIDRKAYPRFHSEKKYLMGRFWGGQRAFLGPLLHKIRGMGRIATSYLEKSITSSIVS